LGVINYVPHLVDRCEVIPFSELKRGDLVVFERTYDAVYPPGIGPEDDMTHIGVYLGNDRFIDFGGDPAYVRNLSLSEYGHMDFFMRPPGFDGEAKTETHNFKLFFRPGIDRITAVLGDVKEEIEDFILHARTVNGNIVSVMHIEKAPAGIFRFGSLKGRVVAMDEKGWKVEVD